MTLFSTPDYTSLFEEKIDKVKAEGRYRIFRQMTRLADSFPKALYEKDSSKEEVTIWCNNDYLGMGQNPAVLRAMKEAIDFAGAGSGGTRNIAGTSSYHVQLEMELASWYQKEQALVFSSAYVANQTSLAALGSHLPGCVIFSDEKNHASMIEGIRHSRAEKHVFRHNDIEHLEMLLQQASSEQPKIIAFESVYSMDGDIGLIREICALAKQYGALTYLDEVHAVGLYGATGSGIAEQEGLLEQIDIINGTLGKAVGVFGGFIAASKTIIDFVRCHAPGFIFTTSLPPCVAAAARQSIVELKNANTARQNLQEKVAFMKSSLSKLGIPTLPSTTHIIPLMIYNAELCQQAAQYLLEEHKIYVQPINYPTVSKGQERFRITPSPLHTEEMIHHFLESIDQTWGDLGLKRI